MRSPFLSTLDLAEYLRFIVRSGPRKGALDVAGARKWAARHGIPVIRRGRAVLVRREDVDARLIDASASDAA